MIVHVHLDGDGFVVGASSEATRANDGTHTTRGCPVSAPRVEHTLPSENVACAARESTNFKYWIAEMDLEEV